ncbi:L,D-transpeptidase family protein [Desulfovibrio ferrophilus]|uniref:L,D-TPase catalytic domain-containing protein n=1 Tax=Desulfovibrio ferrophilus TaxID=241368 RepID=A0A2Z6B1S8_9BACT|nr:L,D-transpeptidase family protein [Desulfovibrio ferrophilus]BBD09477.1 uncharacterized protein DFE_2751 [Desulfovibrio ferrophilus]
MRIVRLFAVLAIMAMCATQALAASGWEAQLAGHPLLPQKFLAVDKDAQTFFIYGHKSPLRVIGSYPCATGQRPGDKLEEGDLKTPEGVYFIQGKLHRKLDWTLYGDLAYPLNFPNPVDKIKGKTGYGIWVHGRGKKLLPRDTQGCVALNTPDLRNLADDLTPGLPVVISKHLDVATGQDRDDAAELNEAVERVKSWANAWQRRSDEFFEFYDPIKYDQAHGGSYAAFKTRKHRLFQRHNWIRVMTHDVRVVPGPDYVVTYFRQYYRTPGMVSEGIKRLYWQRSSDGKLRIVGREWVQTPRTLDDVYLKRVSAEAGEVVEAWRKAWENAEMDAYLGYYAYGAEQGERLGVSSIKEHKAALWQNAKPEKVAFGQDKRYSLTSEGVAVTFEQQYQADNGFVDKGVKHLVLRPTDEGWKIIREEWRAI